MSPANGALLVSSDTTITADVRNCRRLDVHGSIEGDVVAEEVVVHPGGRLLGRLRTGTAEVHGLIEGDVVVRNLIAIRATGVVNGDVQYGRMALDPGGELSAKVRNVPPNLVGDFQLNVRRGQQVAITTQDVAAVDPDNTPAELTYTVSNAHGGRVAFTSAPSTAISTFTQADLNEGRVVFVHDGGRGREAGFDVVVVDAAGASSGKPRRVEVVVLDVI